MKTTLKKQHPYRDKMVMGITLLCLWELLVNILKTPPFILPDPITVFLALYHNASLLAQHLRYTLGEILGGFSLSIMMGCLSAVAMAFSPFLRRWLHPIFLSTQVLPLFVIAPLFVIWFGYGLSSKILTTVLLTYFPITSAFYDGLSHCPAVWLDLGKTLTRSRWRCFWYIRLPAALPALASGVRIAAIMAPMGAVIGEWVGASRGLGFLMLNANARMQIPLMFAALFVLIFTSLLFYASVNRGTRWCLPWLQEIRS